MEYLWLKFNHLLFWWYYKRVPAFFHKWPILKSIQLLVSNYEHTEFRLEQEQGLVRRAIEREKELMAQIRQYRLRDIDPDLIRAANDIFGTDLPEGTEN